jgi:hypothetical protein
MLFRRGLYLFSYNSAQLLSLLHFVSLYILHERTLYLLFSRSFTRRAGTAWEPSLPKICLPPPLNVVSHQSPQISRLSHSFLFQRFNTLKYVIQTLGCRISILCDLLILSAVEFDGIVIVSLLINSVDIELLTQTSWLSG